MRIERLNHSHGLRLRDIRLRALRDAPDAFGSTYAEHVGRSADEWMRQVHHLPTFVAVVEGEDCGIVRGAYDDDGDPETVWLLSMWVDPRRRGQGLGRALVGAVIQWARSTPARRLLLEVGDHNAPAIALYTHMGFVANGITGALPAPRDHVHEHQRQLDL